MSFVDVRRVRRARRFCHGCAARLLPQLAKLFDGAGTEAFVMVVGVDVLLDAPALDRLTIPHPVRKLFCFILDSFFPHRGGHLDLFAVAEKPQV